ncbi:uncharacterized protein RJT20DRAFT_45554 [Scheffersomyces xylosifermentans]|uniref:uncharacterized protein n=1 Tax=Scheffersomyces xylosifermentans TaxID=1304137 RepID=UPI00315D4764
MVDKVDAVDVQLEAEDLRKNERFHLFPYERLEAFTLTAGIIGGLAGFYDGVKRASLRYLTENSHRLPKTVGGWYFYHKKKNYVMIIDGVKTGVKQALKYSTSVGGFFGLEWIIDNYVRCNSTDFLNTTAAATIYSGLFGSFQRLSVVQTRKYVVKGAGLGLGLGLAQDMLRYARGGDVWYLEKLGIKRPQQHGQPLAPA